MPKVQTLQDLTRMREGARRSLNRRERMGTVIAIGMGTCGMAAGARETIEALQRELERRQIQAHLTTVGCIGMCAREPLVEIRQAGVSRILYGNITAEMIGQLVEEHLVNGRPVKQWIVGRMSVEGQ
jgi:NADP-reducing hydrogenase subunit HndB